MRLAFAIVFVVLVGAPQPGHAFHAATSYTRPVSAPNGTGGTLYTGSPQARGLSCASCHVDSAGVVGLEISSVPGGLDVGRYAPDTLYRVTLSMTGEHRGLSSAANENAFVSDLVDRTGRPAGVFEATESTVAASNGSAVIGRPLGGRTSWDFFLRTPAAGSGAIVLFASAVDGNGRDELVQAVVDPFGDDVATLRIVLCENSEGCNDPLAVHEDPPSSAVACSSAGQSSAPLSIVVVFAALAWIRERK